MYPANNFVNVGTKIGISICKSWKSFQWNIDVEGKIHSNLKPKLCIHMKGKRLFLQNCIDGSKNQRWIYSFFEHRLTNVKNGMKTAVVIAESIVSYDKAPVQLLNGVSEAEIWRLDYNGIENLEQNVVDFNIESQLSTAGQKWCLVPANHHLKVGSKLAINTCKPWKIYKWNVDEYGHIRNLVNPSLCISAVFKRMEFQKCEVGKQEQRWMYNKLGQYISTRRHGLLQMTVHERDAVPNSLVKLEAHRGSFRSFQTWVIKSMFTSH